MNKILTAYNYELNKFINDKLPDENIYKPISYIFNLEEKKIRPFFLFYIPLRFSAVKEKK